MDDSFLISNRFAELIRIRDTAFIKCGRACDRGDDIYVVDEDCACQRKFAASLKYLRVGIQESDLDALTSGSMWDKLVKEFNPVSKEFSEPLNIHNDRLNAFVEGISGKVLDQGYSLLFVGHNGSGKTHTATYLLAHAVDAGLSGYYSFFKDIYNLYNKVEYKDSDENDKLLMNHIMTCQFLVIDELGKESLTEPVIAFLEYLVKTRQAAKLPTIFLTNAQIKDRKGGNQVLERYGNSVWDCFRKYFVFQFSRAGDFRAKTRPSWEL